MVGMGHYRYDYPMGMMELTQELLADNMHIAASCQGFLLLGYDQ